ncbi:anaerobic ribonucleoside-triphosphate reductase activating protein [Alkalicella caledoniensis]|uniref:Anaerobic ribonucleoside-triphosphate reductase-activating protein n=1 Tax=Alkalicella caledoniensis TaxID=2731377 RepID=A0A7G9W8I0_ALKCA|nr:anaerobic ribonucleoside-triphosphate reductase activating protein [Alkalicella caledoniensis]QNO14992.1 anaerobic ribonucleoside-triphosphate reductase activating protein [Alkalicella caledoniensis]
MDIRIAGIIPESVVDGPGGISYTIFAQGCLHKCAGCHNPNTHSFQGGQIVDCSFILEDIKKYPLSKLVTFSGGDPFYQPREFAYLATKLKEEGYKLVGYTGFFFEKLLEDDHQRKLLELLDILIDGPFIEKYKNLDLRFRGSSNQRIIDVAKTLKHGDIHLIDRYY